MTSVTRRAVQTWPRKPNASAPRASNTGNWANCSGVSRDDGPRWRAVAQRRDATLSTAPHPLADGALRDAQRGRDLALQPALLFQFPGAQPSPLAPVRASWSSFVHTSPPAHLGPLGFHPETFLTTSERADKARRKRKVKTDIVSRCATAILALTQARKASTDRFIFWYREQIHRIETGEVPVPSHLVSEDLELDLPRQPAPDSASLTDLTWQRKPVRLDLTIWRPVAFVSVL